MNEMYSELLGRRQILQKRIEHIEDMLSSASLEVARHQKDIDQARVRTQQLDALIELIHQTYPGVEEVPVAHL